MSSPRVASAQPVGTPQVRTAIARAAQQTGVDFDYLLAQARIESSLDPKARAGTSSAAGLYQFTNATWLSTLDRHGAAHGLGWAQDAIDAKGGVSDPATRQALMALRMDPAASAMMAGELASDNRTALTTTLGRTPDNAELYLAHFLGPQGAGQFLTALAADPAQPAAALLPKAAGANRSIFYDAGGSPRSVGAVMQLVRGRLGAAMEGAGDGAGDGSDALGSEFGSGAAWAVQGAMPGGAATVPAARYGGPIAQEFHAAAAPQGSADAAATPRASMADTLLSAFAGNGAGAVPDGVRAAYGRLRAFGL
ncbi:transglycosylase SLT domain-containing protein [Novosphingobium lentum]|uniref:transglycosylase SLT domain-containing protein n=1 Tax=Novosphingobium lentum TaxID=145287 RepID=UPI00083574D4|nr:transglycosylase SLT domain-containing protein [Novosphingobium lentum]